MSSKGMNRRQFLHSSGLAAAGAAAGGAVASGTGQKANAADMILTTLDPETASTLLAATRTIYPHETLSDIYYAGVVEALDAEAKGSPDTAKMLTEGAKAMNEAMSVNFVELSPGNRLEIIESMTDTPIFQKIRGTAVVALYNNPLVWRHFGFEGASYDFGGYINRGFNDLQWAGVPSQDASPDAG